MLVSDTAPLPNQIVLHSALMLAAFAVAWNKMAEFQSGHYNL